MADADVAQSIISSPPCEMHAVSCAWVDCCSNTAPGFPIHPMFEHIVCCSTSWPLSLGLCWLATASVWCQPCTWPVVGAPGHNRNSALHLQSFLQVHHDKYWPMMNSLTAPGCFGMSELGHGSNVRGIETTSTYDPATQEFVIHTPSDRASKYWIGGAAQHGKVLCG